MIALKFLNQNRIAWDIETAPLSQNPAKTAAVQIRAVLLVVGHPSVSKIGVALSWRSQNFNLTARCFALCTINRGLQEYRAF
jgi:hypothetical protein